MKGRREAWLVGVCILYTIVCNVYTGRGICLNRTFASLATQSDELQGDTEMTKKVLTFVNKGRH